MKLQFSLGRAPSTSILVLYFLPVFKSLMDDSILMSFPSNVSISENGNTFEDLKVPFILFSRLLGYYEIYLK